jgi:hypothetical protein
MCLTHKHHNNPASFHTTFNSRNSLMQLSNVCLLTGQTTIAVLKNNKPLPFPTITNLSLFQQLKHNRFKFYKLVHGSAMWWKFDIFIQCDYFIWQLLGATSCQLIYNTNTAHSANHTHMWRGVINDSCQIKQWPCTITETNCAMFFDIAHFQTMH